MTHREVAINEIMRQMHGKGVGAWISALSDLIDQAEAGRLKEPLPITYVGNHGISTVIPGEKVKA